MNSVTDSDTVVPPGETAPDKAIRAALCDVLDRLGSDGTCCFLNGDSVDDLGVGISRHVRWLEERAREEERSKYLPALKRALDEAEDLATMYDHYADVSNAPADFAERRALDPALARTEPLPPMSPVAATFFQMRRENERLRAELADVKKPLAITVSINGIAPDDPTLLDRVRRAAEQAFEMERRSPSLG